MEIESKQDNTSQSPRHHHDSSSDSQQSASELISTLPTFQSELTLKPLNPSDSLLSNLPPTDNLTNPNLSTITNTLPQSPNQPKKRGRRRKVNSVDTAVPVPFVPSFSSERLFEEIANQAKHEVYEALSNPQVGRIVHQRLTRRASSLTASQPRSDPPPPSPSPPPLSHSSSIRRSRIVARQRVAVLLRANYPKLIAKRKKRKTTTQKQTSIDQSASLDSIQPSIDQSLTTELSLSQTTTTTTTTPTPIQPRRPGRRPAEPNATPKPVKKRVKVSERFVYELPKPSNEDMFRELAQKAAEAARTEQITGQRVPRRTTKSQYQSKRIRRQVSDSRLRSYPQYSIPRTTVSPLSKPTHRASQKSLKSKSTLKPQLIESVNQVEICEQIQPTPITSQSSEDSQIQINPQNQVESHQIDIHNKPLFEIQQSTICESHSTLNESIQSHDIQPKSESFHSEQIPITTSDLSSVSIDILSEISRIQADSETESESED